MPKAKFRLTSPQPAAGEAPFYIPATGSPSRPRRTLKHNDTFAVLDSHGDIGATSGSPDGLFDCDTRYLSHFELLINGTQPLLLGSAVRDDNLSLYSDLTNPDLYEDGRIVLLKDTVHIARTIYLSDGSLRERITVANHGAADVRLTLSVAFASDFADIFEVRGVRRARRGQAWTTVEGAGSVLLSYRGLDERVRETAVRFEPAPTMQTPGTATYTLQLAPGDKQTIFATVSSRGQLPGSVQPFFRGLAALYRQRRASMATAGTLETSNDVFNEILGRAMSDLYMLVTATPDGPYPYAGIPWYSTTFGRDALITAWEMLWFDPSIAAGVLRRLAHLQSEVDDPSCDATPGKILHEMRGGEMAALAEVPFKLYYGSVDSTPLFVMLAGLYAERTGDYALMAELWPAIERALAWIDGPGDPDGDGFVEYARATDTGLANQGWKDSHDAVFHADGSLAVGPIALVEVQGYVYAAKRLAADCAARLGLDERAMMLRRQAATLRTRFDEAFWCEEIDTYALALDGAKRQCRVRTSNPGHALATGIATRERAARIASGFLEHRFHTGWGIRTVAAGEVRYNPMSYHNGSIWPHDNAVVAAGLSRYGFKHAIIPVFDGVMRAATYMDHRRIPELYCGFRRRPGRGPTLYPAACSPQAWAAACPFFLMQAMLGLQFDPAGRSIRLVNPTLPPSAGRVVVRNLSLGNTTSDFALCQDGGAVSLQVLRTRGEVQLSVVLDGEGHGPRPGAL
jgi:glycogen debranching enzyme